MALTTTRATVLLLILLASAAAAQDAAPIACIEPVPAQTRRYLATLVAAVSEGDPHVAGRLDDVIRRLRQGRNRRFMPSMEKNGFQVFLRATGEAVGEDHALRFRERPFDYDFRYRLCIGIHEHASGAAHRGVIVLGHGTSNHIASIRPDGVHSQRYAAYVDRLVESGWHVLTLDTAGHGLSGPWFSVVDSPERRRDLDVRDRAVFSADEQDRDLSIAVRLAASLFGETPAVGGFSDGGERAVRHARGPGAGADRDLIRFYAPVNVLVAGGELSPPPGIPDIIASTVLLPVVVLVRSVLLWDEEIDWRRAGGDTDARLADPLVRDYATADYATKFHDPPGAKPLAEVEVPILLFQGKEDRVVAAAAVEAAFDALAAGRPPVAGREALQSRSPLHRVRTGGPHAYVEIGLPANCPERETGNHQIDAGAYAEWVGAFAGLVPARPLPAASPDWRNHCRNPAAHGVRPTF